VEAASGPAIETRNVTKTFGRVRAVDDVTVALEPGRVYGLLGPNGSGKTTLIRLLTGLARPDSGDAHVLGVAMPSRENLARIGYMTQADGVYADLSVWENLRFFATLFGRPDHDRLRETLRLVELDGRRDTPAFQLSGGMRRRLSLACALSHGPQVIFLDEPTVGVDPALRVQFWDHFRRLAAGGVTLLVSSHVMDEADRCDELLLMRAGRIIARGTGPDVRRQAGTTDREEAFLKLAPAGPAGGVAGASRASPVGSQNSSAAIGRRSRWSWWRRS
jgi:ABC-2 type transport system ATP-binding protein